MYNYNPYTQPMYQPTSSIVRVNGENGARAYAMAPNSSALLLDESAPLIFLCQTDGAGYKTITPYTITPYKQPDPVNYGELEKRIAKLEAKLNEPDNTSS